LRLRIVAGVALFSRARAEPLAEVSLRGKEGDVRLSALTRM
jgi:hypothetical protein